MINPAKKSYVDAFAKKIKKGFFMQTTGTEL
jgi:hypothetical protein